MNWIEFLLEDLLFYNHYSQPTSTIEIDHGKPKIKTSIIFKDVLERTGFLLGKSN